jgi:NADPH-dependent 2,4-dienoyl-CoA reductase/sulfur reductase-like enzyme
VRGEAGHPGVRLGVRELELDVPVELREALVAAHLRAIGPEEPKECLLQPRINSAHESLVSSARRFLRVRTSSCETLTLLVQNFELVIIGGGLASARAIKSFREAGGEGAIALISKDSTLPYHRPPLSKRFLRGETDEEPLVESADFYAGNGVDVMLETAVASVETAEHTVETDDGELGYRKLLLATGAWPRRLPVPGADLDGVFTLRTVVNSKAIREAAADADHVAIVGAGFIGMEVAASLNQIGKDVSLIHLGRWLFDQLGVEQLSDELAALYEENGVHLVLGNEVDSFHGNGSVEAVTTKNGRQVEADLVVVGIGVAPVTDYLEGSGIDVDNGIVVNERFETSAPDVYAAGDVANFFDPLFNRRRRIEHWSNANYQGTEVGKVLAGSDGGFDTVSTFFTEVFGITIRVFGDAHRDSEVVVHGSLREKDLYALYGDENGEVIGALSVGQSEEVEDLLKQQIKTHAPLRNGISA